MSGDGFLHRYFLNNADKPLHKWLHYFDVYERHFERFRGKSPVVLEIGVAGGGSLTMWKEYFGLGAKIVGIDLNPEFANNGGEGIDVHIGDQADPAFIKRLVDKYTAFDIVIDDGSHVSKHMIASFNMLYEHVQPMGVYLVEDTHTNYWSSFNDGLRKPGSFMEFSKLKIDELNAFHIENNGLPISLFTRSTLSVSYYDSMVVFEKRPQAFRQHIITNPRPL